MPDLMHGDILDVLFVQCIADGGVRRNNREIKKLVVERNVNIGQLACDAIVTNARHGDGVWVGSRTVHPIAHPNHVVDAVRDAAPCCERRFSLSRIVYLRQAAPCRKRSIKGSTKIRWDARAHVVRTSSICPMQGNAGKGCIDNEMIAIDSGCHSSDHTS